MKQGQPSISRRGVALAPLGALLAALLGAVLALPVWSQPLEPPAAPPSPPNVAVARPLGDPAGPPRSGAELDRLTEHLTSRMRCPVCQGLSIAASRSISALNMKHEVRELLAAGYSEDQVLDYFEQAYGEFIRLVPKPRGFNLVVWLLPLALLVLGGAVVARVTRGRSARRVKDADPALADYRERVRAETSR